MEKDNSNPLSIQSRDAGGWWCRGSQEAVSWSAFCLFSTYV